MRLVCTSPALVNVEDGEGRKHLDVGATVNVGDALGVRLLSSGRFAEVPTPPPAKKSKKAAQPAAED